MGRETKILLTLLGLLAGVFMGVVALKLFVPRPPEGTGPDVDMASEPLPLVEPPSLDAPAIEPASMEQPATPSEDAYANRSSRFGSTPALHADTTPPELAVVPVSYEHAVESTPAVEAKPVAAAETVLAPESPPPPAFEVPAPPPPAVFTPAPSRAGPVPDEAYVTRDGDSWWSLAEAAYGDGRLYRALYAWNRSLNERVSLVPGTSLDIPPEAKLSAAWSTLLPVD